MLTAMCDVMKRAYDRGWLTTRDGNVSLRKGKSNIVYITPSGVRKSVIRVEDIIKLKIKDSELVIPVGSKPSGELHMHSLLQLDKSNTKTRVVLHLHPTNVVAAMLAGWELQDIAKMLPELSRYTKVAQNVPELPVTSVILGDITYKHLNENGKLFDIVGQDRHGVCIVGSDPWSCLEHCERLEHACEIVLKSGIKPVKKEENE